MEERSYLLEMIGISKKFAGVKALDDVTFQLERGTVHALMGENGAGKSTLINCLCGIDLHDEGNILLNGKKVNFNSPKSALESGIAVVQQELNQVLKRNVMENIWLGRIPSKIGVVLQRKMLRDTLKIFEELEINIDPRAMMSTLSIAERKMVELARSISYNTKILVLDEPTSAFNEAEVGHLFRILNRLKSKGCGIVFITNSMQEVVQISDVVSIMRDGKMISTTLTEDITMSQILRQLVGREIADIYPEKTNVVKEKVFEVKNFSAKYLNVKDINFHLNKGEILGLAGLSGAGRTALLDCLFGIAAVKSGSIYLNGKEIKISNSRHAKKNGLAFITEDRRKTGMFEALSIKDNIAVASLKKNLLAKTIVSNKKTKANVRAQLKFLKMENININKGINSLTAGEQQKAIFSKWLLTNPSIFLMDEPTHGVDINTKYEIYQLLIDLAGKGKSIILVSSELPELMSLCDRIIVMSDGQIAGEINPKVDNQEKVMKLATQFI